MCEICSKLAIKTLVRRHNDVIRTGFGKWRVCLYSQQKPQISPKQKSRKPATETYKVGKSLSAPFMTELFEPRNKLHYNLRHVSQINTPSMNTIYLGIENISFLGPKTWNLLPNELKNIKSLKAFKHRIENCTPDKCPCRIFEVYTSNVGFIWKKKKPGSSLCKVLRFHVFFGNFIINSYLVLFDFHLLFMILV